MPTLSKQSITEIEHEMADLVEENIYLRSKVAEMERKVQDYDSLRAEYEHVRKFPE